MKKCIANYLKENGIENFKIHGPKNYAQIYIEIGKCICTTKMKEVIEKETGKVVYIDASCVMVDEEYKLLIEVYQLPY